MDAMADDNINTVLMMPFPLVSICSFLGCGLRSEVIHLASSSLHRTRTQETSQAVTLPSKKKTFVIIKKRILPFIVLSVS